jgi:hypothetical protein
MAATKYTFSISTDFPNHKVASDRLLSEVQASVIVTAIDRVDTDGDACNVWFKDILGSSDETALDGIVAAHSGEPLPADPTQVTIAGSTTVLPIQALPPAGLKSNQISQNWCDKTTWWYSSIKVTNETATTSDAERKIWSVVHSPMIDVYHGKLTGERSLTDHRVSITVDGVLKTEQDPHYASGGDYVVDYAAGTITFTEAIAAGVSPLVSYYYENGSTWVIAPAPGEVWRLKGAESQFSDDVEMLDTMVYEVWAYNPADLPNKIQVCTPDCYNSMQDFVNDANKAYPAIPAIGGTGWRGSKRPITVFAWDFQTTTDLDSSWGMELRVRLEHNTPYKGTFATGTFYFIRNPAS